MVTCGTRPGACSGDQKDALGKTGPPAGVRGREFLATVPVDSFYRQRVAVLREGFCYLRERPRPSRDMKRLNMDRRSVMICRMLFI